MSPRIPELTDHLGYWLRQVSNHVSHGFAHGFLTLVDHSEVFYQMSEYYAPEAARGVRWDDPLFALQWPAGITTLSAKDQQWSDATREQFAPFAGLAA